MLVLEGEAVEIFHGDEGFGRRIFADFVDGADVGMVQGGGGAGFAAKAFEGLRVARNVIGQEFEGDEAAELVSSAL